MKRINQYDYSGISSFKDFRKEKERLTLKSKIIDAKLSLGFMKIKQDLTPSNLLISLAREYLLPRIAKLTGLSSAEREDIT
ncbi:MAG: hypothetical protein NTW82_04555 [Bacteroidia bacterium]|nr:hypothetical protein [Bacteroidia bacterium]